MKLFCLFGLYFYVVYYSDVIEHPVYLGREFEMESLIDSWAENNDTRKFYKLRRFIINIHYHNISGRASDATVWSYSHWANSGTRSIHSEIVGNTRARIV